MSQITVHYTPAFSSDGATSSPFVCHRVCYRFNATGAYCCIEDTTPSIAGVPKTFTFTVADVPCGAVPDVDTDACAIPTYDGYVQACCESDTTFDGAVYFTATFVPDPSCTNKLVTCISQQPLDPAFFNFEDAGTGYTIPPTVTIVRDPFDPVPAGGTNDAVVTATVLAGAVDTFSTPTPGVYGKVPRVVISPPDTPGTQAYAYLRVPCEGALGTIAVIDCAEAFSPSAGIFVSLGSSASFCFPRAHPFIYTDAGLTIPDITNFSYAPGGCCDCTTCRNYDVVLSGPGSGTFTLDYYSCTDNGSPAVISTYNSTTGGPVGTVSLTCVVPGSIVCADDQYAIVAIVDTGPCATC